jgi:hypothetical protein
MFSLKNSPLRSQGYQEQDQVTHIAPDQLLPEITLLVGILIKSKCIRGYGESESRKLVFSSTHDILCSFLKIYSYSSTMLA